MILAIQCKSKLSSLTLAKKTCPLGLLTTLSGFSTDEAIVYYEEVSGEIDIFNPELIQSASFILFSASVGNIDRTLYLAFKLSNYNKPIFIGGPEPSMIGPQLLKEHPYLSVLVVGPGEQLLRTLLKEKNFHSNRAFNQNDLKYIRNSLIYSPPKAVIDFENIRINYELLYELEKYEGLSYLWGNDCSQAKKRCFFCGRLSMGIGYRDPFFIWKELLLTYLKGFRFYYNTTDSVTTNLTLFNEFCRKKPKEMSEDIHRVFVNSNQVNNLLIDSLKRLNGMAVLGIESFGAFDNVGKLNTKFEDNLKAIKELCDSNIKIVLSFVFGLPEETEVTIQKNEEGILKLVEDYGNNIESIHISPLLITTGSPAYIKLMSHPRIAMKYRSKKVPFDLIEMSNDYYQLFCKVSRNFVIERIFSIINKINVIAPHIRIGAKGILNSEEKTYHKLYNSFSNTEIFFDEPEIKKIA